MPSLLSATLLQIQRVQQVLADLTTTEGRLAVSTLVLLATVVGGLLVAPYLIRHTARIARSRVLPEGSVNAIDVLIAYFPTTLGTFFVRLVQVGFLIGAVVTLLVVWGLVDMAVTVIEFIGLSLPLVATLGVTMLLLFLGYAAVDLYGTFVRQFVDETTRVSDHQQEILLRMGHVGILAVLIFGVLSVWGADLSGLLVGAGFLGIVVGLAARQTLGSMIAGFVLMFSRPFTIGDWVVVGDDEGFVTDITIMNTRLQTVDGESVVIPNDSVNNQSITNRSSQGHLRLRLDVGVDYETDTEFAQEVALDTLHDIDAVADAPPPQVVPKAFADSAIVLELRFWIANPTPQHRWHATEEVVHNVKTTFDEAGIKIPYPQRELTGRAESGGFQIRSGDGDRPPRAAERPAARGVPQTNGGGDGRASTGGSGEQKTQATEDQTESGETESDDSDGTAEKTTED